MKILGLYTSDGSDWIKKQTDAQLAERLENIAKVAFRELDDFSLDIAIMVLKEAARRLEERRKE